MNLFPKVFKLINLLLCFLFINFVNSNSNFLKNNFGFVDVLEIVLKLKIRSVLFLVELCDISELFLSDNRNK